MKAQAARSAAVLDARYAATTSLCLSAWAGVMGHQSLSLQGVGRAVASGCAGSEMLAVLPVRTMRLRDGPARAWAAARREVVLGVG
jgi:hypothetical protein